jgi:hypothetical protein
MKQDRLLPIKKGALASLMDWISFAGAKRLELTADISSKEKSDKKRTQTLTYTHIQICKAQYGHNIF